MTQSQTDARDAATGRMGDARRALQAAHSPKLKEMWAKRMHAARLEIEEIDALDAAKRERLDQPGERTDE
jgi:hypothetical protein